MKAIKNSTARAKAMLMAAVLAILVMVGLREQPAFELKGNAAPPVWLRAARWGSWQCYAFAARLRGARLVPIAGGAGHQSPLDVMLASQVVNPQLMDDAATDVDGVDMQGWDGVVFILQVGATDTTVDMKAQESTAEDGSGDAFADISGAAITQVPADTGDNKAYAIDVWRPDERYIRPLVTVGDGTTGAYVSVLAIRYRGTGLLPVTQELAELVKVQVN